jgi:hypothetical protein
MIRHRVSRAAWDALAELAGRAGPFLNTLRWLAERLERFAVSRKKAHASNG